MRLLSYNIHKGIGGQDRRYDLSRVIRVIEHENPDIVCLQEVTRHAVRTRHDDQPTLLSEYFAFAEQLFQVNVHYKQGGYGNLILSRWPISLSHHISLRWGRWKPRGAQVTRIGTPSGLLHLANLHLGLRESERRWQVEHLLHHRLFRESAELPTAIVGDFNDWRNKLSSAALSKHGFVEATRPGSRFRSFPAFRPVLALDKFFHRYGVQVTEARVVRTAPAKQASDHLPLVVDFHLTEMENISNYD